MSWWGIWERVWRWCADARGEQGGETTDTGAVEYSCRKNVVRGSVEVRNRGGREIIVEERLDV